MKNKSIRFLALSLAAVMALSDAPVIRAEVADADYEEIVTEELVEADPTSIDGGTDIEEMEDVVYADADEENDQEGDGSPTVSAARPTADQKVIAANLADVSAAQIAPLAQGGTYAVSAPEVDANGKTVTVRFSTTGLNYHYAGNPTDETKQVGGYWQGIGIPQYEGWSTSYFYNSREINYVPATGTIAYRPSSQEGAHDDTQIEDGVTYHTFYFNAKNAQKNEDNCAYLYVKYTEDPKDGGSQTQQALEYVYKLDMSDVSVVTDIPTTATLANSVTTAALEDKTAGSAHIDKVYESYSVTASSDQNDTSLINVKVSAAGLKEIKNTEEGEKAHWAGFAIPVIEGTNATFCVSDTAKESFTEEDFVDYTEEGEPYRFYFNTDELPENDTVYVYARYTDAKGNAEAFTIKAVFETEDFVSVVPTLAEATDGVAAAPVDVALYDGTYEVTAGTAVGNVIPVTVTATGLKAYNIGNPDKEGGSNGNGYWAGISIPVSAKADVAYACSYEPLDEVTYNSIADGSHETTVESATIAYDDFYFNTEAGAFTGTEAKKGYVYVKYTNKTDSSDFAEYVYEVDLSGVTVAKNTAVLEGEVVAAPIADKGGIWADTPIYKEGTYQVSATAVTDADAINVTVSADELLKHSNGTSNGYWVGIGIPVIGDGYDALYCKSYTPVEDFTEAVFTADLDSVILPEAGENAVQTGKTHDVAYFDAGNADMVGGKAYVYAKYTDKKDSANEKIYTFTVDMSGVTMVPTAQSVRLEMDKVTVGSVVPGQELYLPTTTVNILEPATITGSLIVESSNEAVATAKITDDGKLEITGRGNGPAVITVRDIVEGASDTVMVNVGGVYADVTGITLSAEAIEAEVGQTQTLTFTTEPENVYDTVYTWSSSNKKVVSVDEDGVITALAPGKADITLTASHNGNVVKTAVCTVTVKPEASAINIDKSKVALFAGYATIGVLPGTVQLNATVYPSTASAGNVTWTSDNVEVATVSETGLVTAVATGSATITASITRADGSKVSDHTYVTVSVVDPQDRGLYKADKLWTGHVDDEIYTGYACTPKPNVYYGAILLTEGVDYKLSYSNNVNAYSYTGTAFDKKAPTVTVKFTGNYSGSMKSNFSIKTASIAGAVAIDASAPVKTKKVSGVQTPVKQELQPEVYYNGKLIKKDKDYTLSYPDEAENAYTAEGIYNIVITGKGNFADSSEIPATITAKEFIADPDKAVNLSKLKDSDIAGVEPSYPFIYKNIPITPGVSIEGLTADDYNVDYVDNDKVGTAKIVITSSGKNCYGTKTVSFKITKNPVDVEQSDRVIVTLDGMNTAFVKGEQKGAVSVDYSANGISPAISVKVDDEGILRDLTASDYTVTNKVDLKKMTGTAVIKCKGDYYKGTLTAEYKINNLDIADSTFVVNDYAVSTKANAYKKNKIKLYDENGKLLKEKKDYTLDWSLNSNPVPAAGETITVIVNGAGGYDGSSALVTFDIVEASKLLSKAKAKISPVKYAGGPVEITKSQITFTKGKGQESAPTAADYEIIGYVNNGKTGKATVILEGRGDNFKGVTTVNFKIKK